MGTGTTLTQYISSESDEGSTDLAVHFNKNVRPLLDAAHKLQKLEVSTDEIAGPSIVVIGDKFSGRTAVLESLIGVTLQGIIPEMPLVLHLRSCSTGEMSTFSASIGNSGVTERSTIVLCITKPNAPDLTAIKLPVSRSTDDSENEHAKYEFYEVGGDVQLFLSSPSVVIVNVLSANADFLACQSTSFLQEMDKLGERTITVVTELEQAPNDIHSKVMEMAKGVGIENLEYCFLRNRLLGESHEYAREAEKQSFVTHPVLSLLEKTSVGIAALAERVTKIQAKMIRSRLAVIEKDIDHVLTERQNELNDLVKATPSDEDPLVWLRQKMLDNTASMQDRMLRGDYLVQLGRIFHKFSDNLNKKLNLLLSQKETPRIMEWMTELRGFSASDSVLYDMVVREEIDKVSDLCSGVVAETHSYATRFALDVLKNPPTTLFPDLLKHYMQIAFEVVATSLDTCTHFVHRMLAKERSTVFTVNKTYTKDVTSIQTFVGKQDFSGSSLTISCVADPIFAGREMSGKCSNYQLAYALKMRLVAYLSVVFARVVEGILLEVHYSLQHALLKDLTEGTLEAMGGQPMAQVIHQHTSIVERKTNLRKRMDVLKDAKEILRKVLYE